MEIFAQGRYATVASTLALVVALGGTSYAAVIVTGADIKDGTVSTKDVKDGTLKPRDLSAKTKAAMKGDTGPAGPMGPMGPAGPPGAPAQSSHALSILSHPQTLMEDIPKKVLSLALGPGAYFVSSKYLAFPTQANGYVECHLESDGGAQDFGKVTFADVYDVDTVHNQIVVITSVPVTAYLFCRGADAAMTWKVITAVQVASATVTDLEAAP
jgi:hypothetical protein